MKELLKYLIYEQAINVFFDTIRKNLFSRYQVVDFSAQYEQNISPHTSYRMLTFNMDGYIYQFHHVHITKLTNKHIEVHFQTALVFNSSDDSTEVEIWDEKESPMTMDLDSLVESV